jgi:hypothetical protein
MPSELVALRPSQFVSMVLDPRRDQVSKFWTPEAIETIERDQRELRDAYSSETSTKNRIDAHTALTNFNEAWDDLDGRFVTLRKHVGGLATTFANSTSVESNFSVLKWGKDWFRSSPTNLSLFFKRSSANCCLACRENKQPIRF